MNTNIRFWSCLAEFMLEWEILQTKVVENIRTHILCSVTFFLIIPFMRYCGEIWQSQTGHRWQYGTCTLHAGYLRLQTHTQNRWYLLLFCSKSGCTNMSQCCVVCTLPVLFFLQIILRKWGVIRHVKHAYIPQIENHQIIICCIKFWIASHWWARVCQLVPDLWSDFRGDKWSSVETF
jgi:hypothetical protein